MTPAQIRAYVALDPNQAGKTDGPHRDWTILSNPGACEAFAAKWKQIMTSDS